MFRRIRQIIAPPSIDVMIRRELEEARRSLLIAQTGRDWADLCVEYHKARITRLEAACRQVGM